jgi:hypothetical protein
MRLEIEAGGSGAPLDHPGKAGGRERGTALADEHERRWGALPLEPAQRPHLIAEQRVRAGGTILDPPHVQDGGIELHLIPTQVAQFGRA